MFAYLRGKAEQIEKDKMVIGINNIGYLVTIPEGDVEKILKMGDTEITLQIYTDIKENDINLYGFLDKESLSVFTKLIKVSGIGCKVAKAILSFMNPKDVCIAIANEDTAILTKIPGVGPKMAGRIILELKDKILKEDIKDMKVTLKTKNKTNTSQSEAILALKVLGYQQNQIVEALEEMDTSNMKVEEIIKKALSNMNRK
ncbi:MAG: Holliday junction branch migration protein RuvA [Clostridia bacterium]|nr:Holliday junction branch migration protein RuvA [Clostridia bacterium]MDD4375213.1 Holliday junction branch migration protein RuvA [Clostridia bacterium]